MTAVHNQPAVKGDTFGHTGGAHLAINDVPKSYEGKQLKAHDNNVMAAAGINVKLS